MKNLSLLLIFSALTFFIFSCKSDESKKDATEKAAEEFVEGLLENASDEGIDIDIDQDGESAELTIQGEDGTVIRVTNEGKEIPENFPKDVHLVKGDIESAGTMGSDEGEVITIVILPKDSYEYVVDEIKKEMKANGWKSAMNMDMDGEAMFMYSKGDNSATITVNGKENKVEVAYLVTVSK